MTKLVRGAELSPELQRRVLAMFVHRFTGQHKPNWAEWPRPCGGKYPLQFADDSDWLNNTFFYITKSGHLSNSHDSCLSYPTWPNNPELRKPRPQYLVNPTGEKLNDW